MARDTQDAFPAYAGLISFRFFGAQDFAAAVSFLSYAHSSRCCYSDSIYVTLERSELLPKRIAHTCIARFDVVAYSQCRRFLQTGVIVLRIRRGYSFH